MATQEKHREKEIWQALQDVTDPEIPVISVVDLGIINKVEAKENGSVYVNMTPTFVGCPAVQFMQQKVKKKIEDLDYHDVRVDVDYESSWHSNKITDKGRKQLKEFGLSPPAKYCGEVSEKELEHAECPHCGSTNTALNTPFGPTLCRAIHHCNNCNQAFQQFKPVD